MLTMGIDLTASAKKNSTYVYLDDSGTLKGLGAFDKEELLYGTLATNRPTLIAIDAPLSLPQGLCCLEESCSCRLPQGYKGRAAEQELATRGIVCFFTDKSSIIKKLIYRAMGLKAELEARGYEVIEVYPYATKVSLFGPGVPARGKPTSLPYLKERLRSLIPGLAVHEDGLNHDQCDALLAAYTAHLHLAGDTTSLGLAQEGLITIPCALQ